MSKATALRGTTSRDGRVTRDTPSACPACADEAWGWVELLAEAAHAGDKDCVRLIPRAVGHAEAVARGQS